MTNDRTNTLKREGMLYSVALALAEFDARTAVRPGVKEPVFAWSREAILRAVREGWVHFDADESPHPREDIHELNIGLSEGFAYLRKAYETAIREQMTWVHDEVGRVLARHNRGCRGGNAPAELDMERDALVRRQRADAEHKAPLWPVYSKTLAQAMRDRDDAAAELHAAQMEVCDAAVKAAKAAAYLESVRAREAASAVAREREPWNLEGAPIS